MVHARPKALIVLALTACGRLEFEPRETSGDGGLDAPIPDVCPDGYVFVPANATVGTADFCVMRTEAKAWTDANADGQISAAEIEGNGCDASCNPNSASGVVVAADPGKPWRSLDATSAFTACRALGADYDLISNREWITIARNGELVGANWSSGTVGVGRLVEGNSDSEPEYSIVDPDDPYTETGNSAADPPGSGWEQRRTLILSTGAAVWDLSANVQEWVDWTLGGPYDGAPECTSRELTAAPCAGYVDEDYNSMSGTLDRTHGAGFIIGGEGDTARRGGQASDHDQGLAGIFSLNMNRFVGDTFAATGFRCVYRF